MTIANKLEHETVIGYKFGKALFGKPKMHSHIYYVDGMLIDTGHSQMRKTIVDKIKKLSVDQIFITHHHEDHTGNLQQVQQHFKCPAYASGICCEVMKNPPPISFAQKMTWGTRPSNHQLIPTSEFIKTPKHQFEIIPIPGHAIDQVALYNREKGWLFSADLFVNTYINMFLNSETFLKQIESIKKILKLDFEVLFCSHNPKVKGGKELLKKKLQFLEDLYGSVETQYQQTPDADAIFKALKLKENWQIRLLSHGYLSKLNMVRAAVKDIESKSAFSS